MADREEEQLLGYLLGALDEPERKSFENQLRHNPNLLRDLSRARERLQPFWVAQPDFDPPAGLAARTCRLIESSPKPWTSPTPAIGNNLGRQAPPPVNPMAVPAAEGASSHSSWLDLTMAVGIVVAMSLLALPAIQNSRFSSRLADCRNHLRQLGLALSQYSETHDDYFPPVYDRGALAGAGAYAPVLVDGGFIEGSHWFLCPDSPLAEEVFAKTFRVPSPEEMLAASQEELARMRNSMGGSYGYNLGFRQDGRYHSPRNLRRPYFALMADTPSFSLPDHQSTNHGGLGQNVLFEDGRVWFYRTPQPNARADDVFVNDSGMVDAGKHRNDSVIGASASAPRLTDDPRRETEL